MPPFADAWTMLKEPRESPHKEGPGRGKQKTQLDNPADHAPLKHTTRPVDRWSHVRMLVYMRPLLVILGPTASGKTALARALARQYRGEIISADARQVYVGMDIGTAKEMPTGNSTKSAHHLLDIRMPDQTYSAAEFRRDALRLIAGIHRRERLPIVVGGTGLYTRALTEGFPLDGAEPDPRFRAWAERQPLETLVRMLRSRVPAGAARTDLRNRRRVTRALERAHCGETRARNRRPPFDTLKIGLRVPAPALKRRIRARVRSQLRQGLVREVRTLVNRYGTAAPGLQAIGYRDVFPYLAGHASLEDTKTAIVRTTWQYARRQMTWLRKEPRLEWVPSSAHAKRRVAHWLRGHAQPAPSAPRRSS
jgi:tRNA dimethylallyltransferase